MHKQNNKLSIPGFALLVFLVLSIASCDSKLLQGPTLLETQTRAGLKVGTPVSIDFIVDSQAVLIEILGRDTNYRSRVVDSRNELLSEVHLAFLRSAPVYHLIEATSEISSYALEVLPAQTTNKASVTINFYGLSTGSSSDTALISAWRNLSRGVQFVDSEVPEDWNENLISLSKAELAFEHLNQKESALWAAYFKAYFEYYPLYRYSEALESASELTQKAIRLELPILTMLGHQLIGQIRNERESGNDEEEARKNYQKAQENFKAAVQLAQQLDNGFEVIWALNSSGSTYHYQDQPDHSLNRHQEALDLAIKFEDRYLINLIGSNMAVSQEKQGRIRAAIATLLQLQQELTIREDPGELGHILSLLGGYYLKLYLFPQALEVLNQALEISEELGRAESRGRNRLLLGQVYREMGQHLKSMTHLKLAIPDLQASRNGRGLERAFGLNADINRLNQRFESMRIERARQEPYLSTDAGRASWLASMASDAAAEGKHELAIELFRHSGALYASTAFRQLGQLALLKACVLEFQIKVQPACSTETLAEAYGSIQSFQASIHALEGKYAWAQLHASEGKSDKARSLMADLVEEVLFYRKALPGVLGAWYWDARNEIFDFYMGVILNSSEPSEVVALQSFMVLNRIRNAGFDAFGSGMTTTSADVQVNSSEQLRLLAAQRERAKTVESLEHAQRQIDLFLLAESKQNQAQEDGSNLIDNTLQLQNFPDDWSLLTYYFSASQAFAWTANKQGLKLHELGSGDEIPDLIKEARAKIRTINSNSIGADLADLGAKLIAPVQNELRFNIMFIGAGVLSDFPLEALIHEGEFIVRKHRVLNVMSGYALEKAIEIAGSPFEPQRIFLAGNPLIQEIDLPELGGASRELDAVRNQFPGAVIGLYEGANLIHSAFDTSDFDSADLIHIASHASIDVVYPELSRITLSKTSENADSFLTPADLDGKQLSARLVVLSACSTTGLNQFEYDSNLGFVTAFLQNESRQVMASLWPIPDQETARFISEFYREISDSADIAGALRTTKIKMIDSGRAEVDQWAAFQLFSK